MNTFRRGLLAVATILSMAVLVPAASAAISPTVTLDQSAGTQAGSSVALGTDINFAPSPSTDSVKDLTEILPAGLLSDASIDGGACLHTPPPPSGPPPGGLPPSACKIGSGQGTVLVNNAVHFTQPISLYLVAPPQPADLAGIAIYLDNSNPSQQLGSTGEVTVRPSGDPAGVGIDIALRNIPNTVSFGGPSVNISVQDLKTTITALRMPTSCPSPGASYTIIADSYSDPTVRSASAPLNVTGCSSLHLSPGFTVTAVRDTGDSGVQVTTDLTQPATPDQATSRTVVLNLPPDVLGPNAGAVVGGGILCTDPSFASCRSIGTAVSTSPLYPASLTGRAYLTGTLSAPQIALVFPPPFPITLSGAVNISAGSTTFTGVPDLPLTDLQVVLSGGPNSVFTPSCNPAAGTASATLTAQNGDQTATGQAPFTVSNCPPPGTGTSSAGSGPSTSPKASGRPPSRRHRHRPRLDSFALQRFAHERFALRVRLSAGRNAPALRSVSLALPAALRFAHRPGHRFALRPRVSTNGRGIASVRLAGRRLIVVLRRPARRMTIALLGLTLRGVSEAATRRHARRLRVGVSVSVTDAAGHATRFATRAVHIRIP